MQLKYNLNINSMPFFIKWKGHRKAPSFWEQKEGRGQRGGGQQRWAQQNKNE